MEVSKRGFGIRPEVSKRGCGIRPEVSKRGFGIASSGGNRISIAVESY